MSKESQARIKINRLLDAATLVNVNRELICCKEVKAAIDRVWGTSGF